MIISSRILSIPPFLSTPWKNITSLHANVAGDKFQLIVILNNGVCVTIPTLLDKETIQSIFDAHERYNNAIQEKRPPFALPIPGNNELFNSTMQHNPEQADSPEIPKEVLEKITSVAKVLGFEDPSQLPKAEPHCNCPFCQIARAFQNKNEGDIKDEPEVSEKDLQFKTWDIKQTAEKLYQVSNPLDLNEHYSVFLGDPLGCTCGQKNCEHIRAVLNT